jgi:hypothetical protein
VNLADSCAISLHKEIIARQPLGHHCSKVWSDGSEGEGAGACPRGLPQHPALQLPQLEASAACDERHRTNGRIEPLVWGATRNGRGGVQLRTRCTCRAGRGRCPDHQRERRLAGMPNGKSSAFARGAKGVRRVCGRN